MDHSNRPVVRRTVLRGAVLTGLAGGGITSASVLAGCGDSDANSDSGSGEEATSGALGRASEVAVGGATIYADQQVVVSQPARGDFRAFSAVCTHMGCTVSGVEGEEIVCDCHGSRYSIADGSVVKGPATEPLAEESVSVDGDQIVLG